MNRSLLNEIVQHIFANFAIIPSVFVNLDKSKSLMKNEYLLQEKLIFELDDNTIQKNIWGCQISADSQEFKVLLGDCSQEKNMQEFAMVVQLKGSPSYGLFLVQPKFTSTETIDSEAMLSCSLNGKEWMECSTYLQATFLAGMEQVRDLGLNWNKCNNYNEIYESLLSFIRHHEIVNEVNNEGQEERF